ncbi:DHS-like NAD/FAD-binding domain-containing protein [Rhodocollybia butyracea]|uniref:DHS-like NAD/FAD-binding domain-containing protein n=1 Tax=Rhodocollybia butyracea TaxID=206335 RepID=A0A9P5UFY3_9AGAR|nr:DHS-like NAD/FAD-binding domain-containing protein [Rhodocollybia butyracea]
MSPVTLDLDASKADFSTRRSLSDLSLAVAKCKKIVVVTGAGISCSSGIPDFRSSDGLYNLVKSQFPDVVLKGRDLFDASLFRDPTSTAVFYTFISQLKQTIDQAIPTPTHDFIKILEDRGKLLRSYTQNIDGLEERVGLVGNAGSSSKGKTKGKGPALKQCRNVQLHGDIHRVRCQACSAEFPCTEAHLELFSKGVSPDCPECLQRSNARVARSARALRVGSLRPAIVLYDEPHPLGDDIGVVQGCDLARKPDMLIIMGTSLKVHGLKKLVKEFAKVVHSHKSSGSPQASTSSPHKASKASSANAFAGKVVFVNKTPPGAEWADVIDYHVEGATDDWTRRVVEEWKKMRPTDWEVQQTLTGGLGLFKATKEAHPEAQMAVKASDKENYKAAKDAKKKALSRAKDVPASQSSKPDAMVLSTPDAHRLLQTKPISDSPMHMIISPAPISPSKRMRTQSQSHYSSEAQAALEASPSKRRVKHIPVSDSECPEPVERILFAEKTGNRKLAVIGNDMNGEEDDNEVDFMMGSPPPKAKLASRSKLRVESKPLPKSRAGARRVARAHGVTVDRDVFAA